MGGGDRRKRKSESPLTKNRVGWGDSRVEYESQHGGEERKRGGKRVWGEPKERFGRRARKKKTQGVNRQKST